MQPEHNEKLVECVVGCKINVCHYELGCPFNLNKKSENVDEVLNNDNRLRVAWLLLVGFEAPFQCT